MRRRGAGQSSVEYLLILALVAMVLLTGTPTPLEQFFQAMEKAYQNFTYALSVV
jgi:Flp pilus assembly pilin Flp